MKPSTLQVVSMEGLVIDDKRSFQIAKEIVSAAGQAILQHGNANESIRQILEQHGVSGDDKSKLLVKTNSLLFQNHLVIQVHDERRSGIGMDKGKKRCAPLRTRIMCAVKDAAPGTRF